MRFQIYLDGEPMLSPFGKKPFVYDDFDGAVKGLMRVKGTMPGVYEIRQVAE